MISLKKGPIPRSSQLEGQNISPAQRKKYFGDKNLGDVLNNVADPNYAAKQQRVRGVGNNKMGKEAFMKLLLAQLQNQDPTNPLESHDMASQLAQFTSLEKLEGIDEGIKGLAKTEDKGNDFAALHLIGKSVEADSSRLIRSDENQSHDIAFGLAADADEVEITIQNRLGETVKKQVLQNQSKGKNTFKWNGLNEEGLSVRAGDYRVLVKATSNSGLGVHVDTKYGGKITGVNYTADGPVLMIGNASVKLSEVKKIYEDHAQPELKPKPAEQQLKTQNSSSVQPKPKIAPPSISEVMAEGLSSVNMDAGLRDQIAKAAGNE